MITRRDHADKKTESAMTKKKILFKEHKELK